MSLKQALETNKLPTALTPLLADPAIQQESLELLKQDHTLTFVFLKNAVGLALKKQLNMDVEYLNKIYTTMMDMLYTCNDFNFRVVCQFIEIVAGTIRVRLENVHAPVNRVQRERFLYMLYFIFVRYESATSNDELFEEIDYYVEMTSTFLMEMLRSGECAPLVMNVLHALIYQEMHHAFEDAGLVNELMKCGDNRILGLCLKKYTELVDLEVLLGNALRAKNYELVALVLEKTLDRGTLDREGMRGVRANGNGPDHQINTTSAALGQAEQVRTAVFNEIKNDLVMTEKEKSAVLQDELAYFKDVTSTDTYRGRMHTLLRMLITPENKAVILTCPDTESALFVAAVTKTPVDVLPTDRFSTCTFYRMLLSCRITAQPFNLESVAGRAYSCMKAEHEMLTLDERSVMRVDEYNAYLMRASVWHKTRRGQAVDSAVVENVKAHVMASCAEVSDVKVFWYFVDILELCGAELHDLVERILTGGITELVEIALFVSVKRYCKEKNEHVRTFLLSALERYAEHVPDETKNLVLLVTGNKCAYYERFLAVPGTKCEYVLADDQLVISAPFGCTVVHKEQIVVFCSVHSVDNLVHAARGLLSALEGRNVRLGYERELKRAVHVVQKMDERVGAELRMKLRDVRYGMDLNDRWPLFILDLFCLDGYSVK
ncbi:hypothetical protein THOM_1541 [Trachipleistophora hominis]|uniref:Uncharacterized protein n=1 Tax=Trachipleistophora hominis TaxID=72359 RepID=L7JWR0_TRAHO|nr:hypothetical protein THOM_1541 [Trachipleistophora hominis]